MIRQDYIMRMIEQLVEVLSKILFNKKTENYQEALNNIDTAFKNIVGLDYSLISSLSAKDIISLLGIYKDDPSASIKYIIIARLLKERIEIKNLSDGKDLISIHDYQKILNLYLEGILNNSSKEAALAEYYLDIKEIVEKLRNEIPDDISFKLFRFYEFIREYDKAGQELFKLKDKYYPNIKDVGIKFYRNLEKLSDADLQKTNLSKKEVEDALSEFL